MPSMLVFVAAQFESSSITILITSGTGFGVAPFYKAITLSVSDVRV